MVLIPPARHSQTPSLRHFDSTTSLLPFSLPRQAVCAKASRSRAMRQLRPRMRAHHPAPKRRYKRRLIFHLHQVQHRGRLRAPDGPPLAPPGVPEPLQSSAAVLADTEQMFWNSNSRWCISTATGGSAGGRGKRVCSRGSGDRGACRRFPRRYLPTLPMSSRSARRPSSALASRLLNTRPPPFPFSHVPAPGLSAHLTNSHAAAYSPPM